MSEVGSGSSKIGMSEVGGRGARGWEIDGGSLESRGQRSKVGGERWEEEGGRWEENQARAIARACFSSGERIERARSARDDSSIFLYIYI